MSAQILRTQLNKEETSNTGKIRILSVIPTNDEGGKEKSLFVFAKREVDVLEGRGVDIRSFFLRSRTSPKILFLEWQRFRRELKSFQPDIIHAHFGTMTAFFCALNFGYPLIITFRGSDLNPQPSVPFFKMIFGRLLSQIAAFRSARIVCVSEQLRQRLWVGKNRTSVIPSGVNLEIFKPIPRKEARAKLGWGLDEKIVLFNAGRFPAVKRLDLAQKSVDEAVTLCGPIRFVVLDGFVDPDQVPLMMGGSDCLIVTSDFEGSPTIVQEAMACDLPVVSVDVGDVSERLAQVSPSRIVDRDPVELGHALKDIILMGKRSNGYEAAKKLDVKKNAEKLLSIYKSVI